MNTQQATTAGKRIASIDIVKGIAIILVVYGHVMQGMAHRNLLYMPFQTFSDTLIYSFHMPAFFFASGLFAKLYSNASSTTLITKKAQQLLWPYLLWELITLVSSPFVGQYTMAGDHNLVLKDVVARIALGTGSWFLWTLFLVYVIAILTRRVERRSLLLLSLALYVAVYFFGSYLPGSASRIFTMLPYFVLGSRWADEFTRFIFSLETNPAKKSLRNDKGIYGLLLTFFLVDSVAMVIYFKLPVAVLIGIKLLQGLAGTALLILIAASLTTYRRGAVLTTVGIASLAIFLLHPYFQGLSRLIITRAVGEANPAAIWISVIIQTAAAVCGPVLIYSATLRYGGTWLFYFPQKSKASVPALSKAG